MSPQLCHLIVYLDNDTRPQFLNIELGSNDLPRLQQCIADILPNSETPIESIHYWSPDQNAYCPLASVEEVTRCGGRAQLWVQTAALRLEEVHRTKDREEFLEVSAYVEAMRTDRMTFSLSAAFRIRQPVLEKRFQEKVSTLVDRHAASVLLFYGANGNTGADALENGFRMPLDGSGLLFTTTMGDTAKPFSGPQKALLCEVAVGKVVPPASIRVDASGQKVRMFDPTAGDSVVEWKGSSRCYTIYDVHQAIPRYLVDIVGTPGRPPPTPQTPSSMLERAPSGMRRADTTTASGAFGRRVDSVPPSPTSATYRSNSPLGWSQNQNGNNGNNNKGTTSHQRAHSPKESSNTYSSSIRCPAHPEEATALWCATCHLLVCSYCLSIGDHRGHDGRDLDYVLANQANEVDALIAEYGEQHRLAAGRVEEISLQSKATAEAARQAELKLNVAFAEIQAALNSRHRELADQLQESESSKKNGGVQFAAQSWKRLADLSREKLQELQSLRGRIQQTRQADENGKGGGPGRRVEAVKALPSLLKELRATLSRERCPRDQSAASLNHNNAAVRSPTIDLKDCLEAIRRLGRAGATTPPPAPSQSSNVTNGSQEGSSRGGGLTRRASVSMTPQLMSSRNKLLDDLFQGYIWTVPNAAVHFGLEQRSDLLSDVFHLGGCEWELKLVHVEQKDGEVELNLFLRSHNHTNRTDFRVSLFNNGKWHSREATDWAEGYKGKGWGIRPFCSKKMLLSEYVRDGCVKFCIVRVGELY